MGEVYRARDSRLAREVAIKVIAEKLSEDARALARFEREARAVAALNHPNVLSIHDYGHEGDITYAVMELLEGETLQQRLIKGRLPASKAFDIGKQIAKGLAAAHAKGIVHRDLKPANVFLSDEDHVKILDFGLARTAEPPLGTGGPLSEQVTAEAPTRSGLVLGTIGYMAPEQARGQPADGRSDIFAFGVVLYEMLSGRRAFLGDTASDTLAAILMKDPDPLPSVTPQGLDRVVRRCLEKRPEGRFQSAHDLALALETASTTGGPVGTEPAKAGWLRRHWIAAAAATGSAAVVLVAALLALDAGGLRSRLLGGAGRSRSIRMAVLPFANLSGDPKQEYLSDGLTQEMIAQLGRLHPAGLSVISRTSVMRYKKSVTPIDQIGRELNVDYVLEGSARREADRIRITAELIDVHDQTQLWSNSYERGLSDVLELQGEVARDIAGQIKLALTPEEETRLASSRRVDPQVYEAYTRGMYFVSQNTPESFEKGIALLHQAVAIDPAEPLAYIGLAEGYITRGHGGGEQAEAFKRARAAAEMALKLDPDRAEAVGVLADVALYYEWDWAKAEILFKRAIELNASLAMTHYHYAWYLALFDRLEEAIAEHKMARDLDPLRALNTGWLGQLYNYAGRFDEAIVEGNKALDLDPRFGPSFIVLRFAYSSKAMHKEAIAIARRQIEANPTAGKVQLVTAYALAGRKDEALEILSALDLRGGPANLVALMYLALGDREAALRTLEAGYEAHWVTLPWVRVRGNSISDALRDEPRFQALLQKMNLPGAAK